jgi:sulfate transport system substrate-binding protein
MGSGDSSFLRRAVARAAAAALTLSVALYAAWPLLPWARTPDIRTVLFYGFSILGEVMNDGIFPAFQAEWQSRTGEQVEFISSFSGSGTITNQMILGVPADVALLSLELDALRLVDAGVLDGPTWHDLPHQGVVNRTPFIILVRPGNPLGIRSFADLGRPGVGVVHPDPLTSGGAQWAILAEYGSALRTTGDPEIAHAQLLATWRNVVAQAASARAARTQFESGFGDALITYEQEVVYDMGRGRLQGAIVYPESTILSEHTLVVLDRNIEPEERELIDAFVEFLWSDTAQRIFVEHGFRSLDPGLTAENQALGEIPDAFTVADLGGWPEAKREVIDAIWRQSILPEVGQ